MANKKYRRGWRIRKAYWTAFVVMMSYIWLHLKAKIFGSAYYQKRIVHLHIKNAHRVKKAILQLEGLFIKVGQLLSILSNFLPEAFQEPLEALQDQIPARPYSEIRNRIIRELGKPPEELFAHFSEEPMAAASIGQAHRARLHEGQEVVVKIQHANIEEVAEVDLAVMQRLTQLFSRFMNIKGIEHAYTQVRKMIEEELDFEQEASAMCRIRENLKEEEGLSIPEVHSDYSTQRVLTTTYYSGVKINQLDQLETWGINRREVANRLLHAYCRMVFDDGFYHADPHPGNILVQEDGTIVLLDFGAVASLRPEMRTGFLELIEGAVKNDTEKIIQSLQQLGFIAEEREAVRIAEKTIEAFRNFLQNEVQFEGLSLTDIKVNPFDSSLFNLVGEIGLKGIGNTVQVPREYVLLNRMLTLLLGICNTLDSHVNPLEIVRPYFQQYVLGEKGDIIKFVSNLLQQSLGNTLALPGDMRKLMKKVERGEVEIELIGYRDRNQLIFRLGSAVVFALLLIAGFGFALYMRQSGDGQSANYLFTFSVIVFLLLLRSLRKARKLTSTS
ncbi:MAG: AarF/UbiB family protein [Bacteroidota bacterium]